MSLIFKPSKPSNLQTFIEGFVKVLKVLSSKNHSLFCKAKPFKSSMEAGPADDERGIGVGSEEVPAENNTTQDAERPDHATRTTAAATNRTFLPPTTSLCDHYCLSSPIVKRKLTFWLPLESQKGQISMKLVRSSKQPMGQVVRLRRETSTKSFSRCWQH